MHFAPRPPRGSVWLAGALLTVFAGQSFLSSRIKSPVYDEPPHIASGLLYLQKGIFTANRQHPPLLKEIAAASMLLAGIGLPETRLTDQMVDGEKYAEWRVGNSIVEVNPDRVMFWGRLPFILIATGLGLLIYIWGREMLGEAAGLGAVFLYTIDPTILAHSYLVATDVGFAAFGLLFLTMLWRYVRMPSWKTAALAGLALGLALTSKFSAVFLLPVAALLLAVALLRPVSSSRPATAGKRRKPDYRAGILGAIVMCLLAMLVIDAVYFSLNGIAPYIDGLQSVNADHDPNHLAFLAGRLEPHFAAYFAVAYLLKEPLASILLAALGLVLVSRSSSLSLLHKLFLMAPPLVLFVAYSLWADDFGVRYLIPMLPFAYLLGGAALAWLVSKSVVTRALAALLGLWLAVNAAGIYPDHLAYFNEAACLRHPAQIGWDAGARCGPEWLDDSNVDWGQGLKQLSDWIAQNGHGRPLRFAYFGFLPPDAYGLTDEDGTRGLSRPDASPGLYAVSATYVARMPAVIARQAPGADFWLARKQPIAIVGHSIYIYDFPK